MLLQECLSNIFRINHGLSSYIFMECLPELLLKNVAGIPRFFFAEVFLIVVFRIFGSDPPEIVYRDFAAITPRVLHRISTGDWPGILGVSFGVSLIVTPRVLAAIFREYHSAYIFFLS